MRKVIAVNSRALEKEGRKRILLINDDVGLGELLQSILQGRSYEVTMAHTGADAMKAILSGGYDVIVYDGANRIPVESFHFALERTKKNLCQCLVLITPSESDSTSTQLSCPGGIRKVYKPVISSDLMAAVGAVVNEAGKPDTSQLGRMGCGNG